MKNSGFFDPQRLPARLGIQRGMRIADFGCGSGEIAVLFARAVGKEGAVTAIDVLASALESVQAKAKVAGLANITTVRANLEAPGGSSLAADSQDLVFLGSILWQSQQPEAVLEEAARVLKNNGTLAAVEWKKHVDPAKLKGLVEGARLLITGTFPAGAYHHGLLATKR